MAIRQLNLHDLPDFFDVKTLAAVLGIGEARAYELTRRRGFPALRLGRTIRISKTGFAAWTEQNFCEQNKKRPEQRALERN